MAKQQASTGPVDLFGNSRLTPRQVMQKQLQALLQSTAERTAGADPRTQGVSQLGAALGGILRNTLIDKGVLPKPPEVEVAERRQKAREALDKDAADKGIDPVKSPSEFAKLAAGHFLNAGDEQGALMAVQWGQLQEAAARKAELDAAETENKRADTAKKQADAGKAAIEAGQLDEKLDLLRRQVADKEARTKLFAQLTQLKRDKTGPGQKTVEIVEGYMKRAADAEKRGEKAPGFTETERKALDELQKAGFMDRILLGGAGSAPLPSGTGEVLDLSSQ